MMIFIELLCSFLMIGLFSFGGGYGMLSVIQGEVVTRHAWLTAAEFTDIVAVSQMTPGPIGINSATYVGYTAVLNATGSEALAVLGSFTASFAVMLPSVVLMLIALFFRQFRHIEAVNNVFKGLRPAVVALIAVPVFNVAKSAKVGWTMAWIPVLSALLIVAFGVSPVFVILVAGIAGFVWGKIRRVE